MYKRTHDNNKSATMDRLIETCLSNNLDFREELNSTASSLSPDRTEQATNVFFQPWLSENMPENMNRMQNKEGTTPVALLTLLNNEDKNDEHGRYCEDSNLDDSATKILVPGKPRNCEDDVSVSRRQQVRYFFKTFWRTYGTTDTPVLDF